MNLTTLVFSSLALGATLVTATPRRLLDFRSTRAPTATLHDSVLILIDAQREYVDGKLPLTGIEAAVAEAAALLDRARHAGTPVIHIVQRSAPGGALFDPDTPAAAIVDALAPRPGEPVIAKTAPSAFFQTTLDEQLRHLGRKNLIIAGYMTHMCVAASTHAAFDLNYNVTVVANACATRDIPGADGAIVAARDVHRAHLAGLADRFATVVQAEREIPE